MHIGKLEKSSSLAKPLSAFLFEPKELVPFEIAWSWQRDWQKSVLDGRISSQAVWLLEHEHCYTLGRGASKSNLLFDIKNSPYELFWIDRGGEVTYHLPGQLIVYPVLDLNSYQKDLNWYLRELESVLIDVLQSFGLKGRRIPGLTGCWLEDKKVGSIGISCRRWITQHGLALNVDCDLDGFKTIIPCGILGKEVGRLKDWIPDITVKDVKSAMRDCMRKRFQLVWNYQKIEQ